MDIIKELWRGNVAQLEQCAMGDRQSKEVLKRAVKRNAVLLERRLYVCYNAYKKGGVPPLYLITHQRASAFAMMICNSFGIDDIPQ